MPAPKGRPTKYTDTTVQDTLRYMDEWETLDQVIPSIAGLAVYLKVSRDSIYEWSTHEDKQDFSDTLDELLAKQEMILFTKGLNSAFNSTITKLALGNHGYHDKADNTHSGPDGGPIAIDNDWVVKVVDA